MAAFFSIITPLYNKENHIKKTLEKAFSQTFTDFELIVVDDGSTDNSEAIVKSFSDSRLTYIKQGNAGVSAARNKGIQNASGKIIAFLDADDEWEENHLQSLFDLHKSNPTAGLLTSRYIIRIGNGKLIYPSFEGVPDNYKGIVTDSFASSLTYRLAVTSAVAVPREVFDTTGTFNTEVTHPEDTELWIKIALKFPVAITDTATMLYNFDLPESWSRKKMEGRKLMDFHQFMNEEKKNKNLKAFIDIYRVEYALKFRIEGNITRSKELLNQVSPENIHYKTKALLNTPPFVLRLGLQFKHWLHKKGIAFSVYN